MADFSPGYPIGAALDTAQTAVDAPDHELITLLRAGSGDAFEVLIHQFQHPVYNLVARLVDDAADAPDVLQEVFLKVFRKIGSFRGQSSLKTWIYRIAVNEAHNHRRSSKRHRGREVELEHTFDDGTTTNEYLADPQRSPFDMAANEETRRQVEEALTQINPAFKAAVVLRDLDGLSYEEIAEVMDVSLGTVKSRIVRGREALREALLERDSVLATGRLGFRRG